MRRMMLLAVVVGLGVAGCSSSTSTPSAAPTGAAVATTSQPPATCGLKSQGDVIERIVTPGNPATAQQLGGVDLAHCELTFNTLAQETSTDPGYCTTAALLADNPSYNVDAVPAPPLKKVQAQAGAACG